MKPPAAIAPSPEFRNRHVGRVAGSEHGIASGVVQERRALIGGHAADAADKDGVVSATVLAGDLCCDLCRSAGKRRHAGERSEGGGKSWYRPPREMGRPILLAGGENID